MSFTLVGKWQREGIWLQNSIPIIPHGIYFPLYSPPSLLSEKDMMGWYKEDILRESIVNWLTQTDLEVSK